MANYAATVEARFDLTLIEEYATYTVKVVNNTATNSPFPDLPYGTSPWA